MAKKKKKVNPKSLANLKPAKPGEVRNPKGRKTAGATIREWINSLAEQGLSEAKLRKVARDRKLPWPKRAAAERILRTLEVGDLADMEAVLHGDQTLQDLRGSGVNTEVIKKIKVKVRTDSEGNQEVERELELYDRAGVDFDRVIETTDGKYHRLDTGQATDRVLLIDDLPK